MRFEINLKFFNLRLMLSNIGKYNVYFILFCKHFYSTFICLQYVMNKNTQTYIQILSILSIKFIFITIYSNIEQISILSHMSLRRGQAVFLRTTDRLHG